jgi:Domain of unknown function (DUF1902)
MKQFTIKFIWADYPGVWVATSNDLPELTAVHGSWFGLMERLEIEVPELLAEKMELLAQSR